MKTSLNSYFGAHSPPASIMLPICSAAIPLKEVAVLRAKPLFDGAHQVIQFETNIVRKQLWSTSSFSLCEARIFRFELVKPSLNSTFADSSFSKNFVEITE